MGAEREPWFVAERLPCFLGFHSLWTNVHGPHENIFTCVDCGRRKWKPEWDS